MSNIYEKISGDKTLVLAPREGFMRKFNVGEWTDMAMGMYFTGIRGDNTAISPSETVTIVTNADRITVGLKNSSNTILPGFSGSYFVGAGIIVSATSCTATWASNYGENTAENNLTAIGYNGTASIGGSDSNYKLSSLSFPENGGTAASSYNAFFGVRFVITNRGASNQTILVKYAKAAVPGTDYSTDALRIQLNNQTWNNPTGGTSYPIAWNDGVSALPIPDAFWVRMPYNINSIRMSSVAGVKFA